MDENKKAKFAVGDEIAIISNGSIGVVQSVVSHLGDGDNIYLVKIGNIVKTCVESNMRISRKKNVTLDLDIKEIGIKQFASLEKTFFS